MLFLGALAASCAGRQYKGEAGLRKNFPDVVCGKTITLVDDKRYIETRMYKEGLDLGLFEEFGYCVAKELAGRIGMRAAVLHGEYGITDDGRFYGHAPGTAVNPQAWAQALKDADANGDGNITRREADDLVSRTLREVKAQKR